jgi:ribosomal protein S18 acetylase RimI-like enzyme
VDALANPIWHALTTDQARFARARGQAVCFPGQVTALAGLRDPTAAAAADLAALLAPDETTGLFLHEPLRDAPALEVLEEAELLQLVYVAGAPTPAVTAQDDMVELGPADHAEMQALAALTQPGPFGARTHELGAFLGIRVGGRLAAMAGQRLRVPGRIEVSAVCTHPDHLGQGHARRLTRAQIARIAGAGATPFLGVRAVNQRALVIYQQLGFQIARRFLSVVVRAAG